MARGAGVGAGGGGGGGLRVLRAAQLDARELDGELRGEFLERLGGLVRGLSPGAAGALGPELGLAVDLVLFGGTVGAGRPSPGMDLLNLRLRSERGRAGTAGALRGRSGVEGPGLSRAQRVGAVAALAGGRWVRARLERLAQRSPARGGVGNGAGGGGGGAGGGAGPGPGDEGEVPRWQVRLRRALEALEGLYAAIWVLNFVGFLRDGAFCEPWERALGIRAVYRSPQMLRALSLDYTSREMVWTELAEMALIVLPALQVHTRAARRAANRALLTHAPTLGRWSAGHAGARGGKGGGRATSGADVLASACPLCGVQPIQVPCLALPCEHAYCYFCLRSATSEDPRFLCLACSGEVKAISPWAADRAPAAAAASPTAACPAP